jgi:hypothetical protein
VFVFRRLSQINLGQDGHIIGFLVINPEQRQKYHWFSKDKSQTTTENNIAVRMMKCLN